MNYLPHFDRRLGVLLLSQALAGSTIPVLFIVSGILGPQISPSLELSTLPVSLVVVGVALGSMLVGAGMSRLGRKRGHLLGLMVTIAGVAVSWRALSLPSFYLYNAGALLTGIGCAFNNQVRFTAADNAGAQKGLVHSWVLMFGLFAAILGPGIAEFGREVSSLGQYTGSLAILLGVLVAVAAVFLFLFPADGRRVEVAALGAGAKPGLRQVLQDRKFWQAVLPGAASFVTMTLLMTATPIEMHHNHHFSHGDTTSTIRAHIVAMYFPSLFGGLLIAWLGLRRLISMSVLIFLTCIAIGFVSHSLHEFFWALVLLGVGWNFLFLAGSTLISQSFDGPERFTAQSANDTIVFSVQAMASLAAGWLIFAIGWKMLVLLPVPLLLVVLWVGWRQKASLL